MVNLSELSDFELIALYEKKSGEQATYDATQNALKIALNSLYGSAANQHFRYFSNDIAEGITLTGQMTIKFIANSMNTFLNDRFKTVGVDYVIASDTDSIYIVLDQLVKSVCPDDMPIQKKINFVDKFAKTYIEPFIDAEYERLAIYVNAFENIMSMKREAIADVGIWRGKKNYVLQVWDNEGVRYAEPDLKMMGIETARSSTPKIVRTALEECLNLMINEDELRLQTYVKDFKFKFMDSPIESISFPRGISDIDKWVSKDGWISGAPIHVKAAITYNRLLRETGLIKKLPVLKNGDKIKFIYLKVPNPTHNNAIAFPDTLPKEFDLDKYINKEQQWFSTFLSPVKSFTDILRWSPEKVNTCDDLFGGELQNYVAEEKPVIIKQVIQPKIPKERNITSSTKSVQKKPQKKKENIEIDSLFA